MNYSSNICFKNHILIMMKRFSATSMEWLYALQNFWLLQKKNVYGTCNMGNLEQCKLKEGVTKSFF